MVEAAKRGARTIWTTARHMKWHHWARLVAALMLLDQALGPVSSIPSDVAVVVVSLGALFAPIPTDRRDDK